MPPAYAIESNNSYKASPRYLPAQRSAVRGGQALRIVGTKGDACNFGPGCQISIIENITGKFVADILPDLTKRLNEIHNLPDNWDGQGTAAPNTQAFLHASEVIEVLCNMNFVPTKLVPSAEEGIGIYFAKENRYGFVECFNEGEIVVAMSDREGHRRVWQVRDNKDEIEEALEILKDFVNAT